MFIYPNAQLNLYHPPPPPLTVLINTNTNSPWKKLQNYIVIICTISTNSSFTNLDKHNSVSVQLCLVAVREPYSCLQWDLAGGNNETSLVLIWFHLMIVVFIYFSQLYILVKSSMTPPWTQSPICVYLALSFSYCSSYICYIFDILCLLSFYFCRLLMFIDIYWWIKMHGTPVPYS